MDQKKIVYNNAYHLSDYVIRKILIEGNMVYISLSFNDFNVLLTCNRFIGIKYLGQWEQGIVSNVEMKSKHTIIQEALQQIEENNNMDYLDNIKYNPDWSYSDWKVLIITLVDEIKIEIACKEIFYECTD